MPFNAPWYDQYQIAAGYNNASALKPIEGFIPSGDRSFAPPSAYSSFNAGMMKIRLDGTVYLAGYPSAIWLFTVLTRKQYQFLMSTYSTGGTAYSGKVTIKTRKPDGSFGNYNAVMLLPLLPELNRVLTLYRDVPVKFTRLVAI